ncbi:type II toxin-antitoxin system HicB family antitoxin [uncultured Haemophilus sp.]|uniref:type II toxin-antitoxin system HicB family antitoxin n=1 Tax=uncultured Haemophilus sp. TaxID=237779 RepID=UPI0025DD88D6|nr:type II toxin-antitoxin system HicB family antitoxin [uncultured Haemophilus sp.]
MKKSNVLTYRGYCGSIESSVEDRVFFGKILCINDLVNYEGSNFDELENAFKEAVDDYLAFCEEEGIEPDKPFSGNFNVRIPPQLHREIAILSSSEGMSLNSIVQEALEHHIAATKRQIPLSYQFMEKELKMNIRKISVVNTNVDLQSAVRFVGSDSTYYETKVVHQ